MKKFYSVILWGICIAAAVGLLILLGSLMSDETMVAKKPVIYLYPEQEQEVSVRLEYDGELTCTYPEYKEGWTVTAEPDGRLTDRTGTEYNYLYWEGTSDWEYDFSEGFCVAGKDSAEFLEGALAELGLTRREANAYNLISFQAEAYTEHAGLVIEPEPDTVIRVFMAYQPADSRQEIPEQELDAPERTGFTVVEWGGCEVGK
ncbi:MAG: hypothetical protein ACLVJ4_01585 [Mediterraneibacter sp.]